MSGQPQGANATVAEPRTTLGLKELLLGLPHGHKHNVLDLGPASGGNVSFFAQQGCKLYIADLYQTLRQRRGRAPEKPAIFDRELEAILPEGEFDVILCWDLLNYLSPELMRILSSHLERMSAERARLFALIAPHGRIPEQPQRFEIQSEDEIQYTCRSAANRPAPALREPELNRFIAPFAVESSYLLRHGMQEYILVRDLERTTTE